NRFAVGRPLNAVSKLNRLARSIISNHAAEHLKAALDETRERHPHLYVKFLLAYLRPNRIDPEDDDDNEFRHMETAEEVITALRSKIPELDDLLRPPRQRITGK